MRKTYENELFRRFFTYKGKLVYNITKFDVTIDKLINICNNLKKVYWDPLKQSCEADKVKT
ncbi:hypothetical protein SATMO3_29000 [Sporomusa aerivorans]